MSLNFTSFFGIAHLLSCGIKAVLLNHQQETGFVGAARQRNLKAGHEVDRLANDVVLSVLKNQPCNIFLESGKTVKRRGAEFSVFVDPVDGSLNWDRGVGDPCIVIAASSKTKEVRFKDLEFIYVEGLRSRDRYYLKDGRLHFRVPRLHKEFIVSTNPPTRKVSEATIYLRHGYSLADRQLEKCLPLLRDCKDTRAIENTGMELCEVARNAAQALVEARQGSDHFNLLTYPAVKSAGGLVTDLEGHDIGDIVINPHGKQDFIACANAVLLKNIITMLNK